MSERLSPQPRVFKTESGQRLEGHFAVQYFRQNLESNFGKIEPQQFVDRQNNKI